MSLITQYFQPPLYWQQFEDLTAGVFEAVYRDPRTKKFGRPGQAQNGVDVFGKENGNGRLIAIQCKRMDELDANNLPLPGGAITKKILDAEIAEVLKGFKPLPDEWILATTAKRDAAIQKYAMELDKKSRAAGSFGIQLWFWDDFIADLNRHHGLQQWYYSQVIQVRSPQDQDNIILELVAEAFSRDAFRMPLHLETPSEFVDALKDTIHALNMGELKDRETRRVIRKAIAGRRAIASDPARSELQIADQKLSDLRISFQKNLSSGSIQNDGLQLMIPPNLQSSLQLLRSDAIKAVNNALKHAGLATI